MLLSLTLPLTRTPQCPICRQGLDSSNTSFFQHVAMCSDCTTHVPTNHIILLSLWSHTTSGNRHFITSRGLTFFAPLPSLPSQVSVPMIILSEPSAKAAVELAARSTRQEVCCRLSWAEAL